MDFTQPLIVAVAALIIGAGIGYLIRQLVTGRRRDSIELKVKKLLFDAKDGAQKILDSSKQRAESIIEDAKKESHIARYSAIHNYTQRRLEDIFDNATKFVAKISLMLQENA